MWWLLPLVGGAILISDPPKAAPPPSTQLWQPGLWALGAGTSIYVGLAAMEGIHNRITHGSLSRALAKRRGEYATNRPKRIWTLLNPHQLEARLSLTVLGLNYTIYRYCQEDFRNALRLADSYQTNWSLLTSAFCHIESGHLASNMWAIIPDIPHLLQACGQSPYQFVAFYLCAAIFSSYAQRIVSYTQWSRSWMSYIDASQPRGIGASGVAMAVFAASCFTQSWTTPSFLLSVLSLSTNIKRDIEGLICNEQGIGFVAHLAGAAFGAAYAYLNVDYYLWAKLVRLFSGRDSKKSRPKPSYPQDETADLDMDEIVRRLNSST